MLGRVALDMVREAIVIFCVHRNGQHVDEDEIAYI